MLPDLEPTLSGHGLTLRPWRASDTGLVRSVAPDPVIPLITTVPTLTDEGEVLAFIARQLSRLRSGSGVSFVIENERGTPVGQAGLTVREPHRASVGYWVTPSARRQGHATHALRLLVDWAWTLPGLVRLEATVEPWNQGSLRVLESVGFLREAVLSHWQVIDDEARDMVMLVHPGPG